MSQFGEPVHATDPDRSHVASAKTQIDRTSTCSRTTSTFRKPAWNSRRSSSFPRAGITKPFGLPTCPTWPTLKRHYMGVGHTWSGDTECALTLVRRSLSLQPSHPNSRHHARKHLEDPKDQDVWSSVRRSFRLGSRGYNRLRIPCRLHVR